MRDMSSLPFISEGSEETFRFRDRREHPNDMTFNCSSGRTTSMMASGDSPDKLYTAMVYLWRSKGG